MRLFSQRKSKPRPKAVIFGLEGVHFSLLRDLMSRGRLNNMARLFQNGRFGKMEVSISEGL